ncbi:MAG: translational GTPase TypA [Clostridiales bacterium]|nr:translational GTPase TypA [Clostridiales bacterium]
MKNVRNDIRNVAIIAHVDHGKTSLVDQLLKQSGVFRANQEIVDRVMDSTDLERERGITILSKNTAILYDDIKINVVDTPGHADFGGEVERVLKMVDGVLLLVDAFEGPMPQTKFVLKRALELDLKVVVVINKMDRPGARPLEVMDEVIDLLIDLGANDEQLDCPYVYASAREGWSSDDFDVIGDSMVPLFKAIVEHIPAPAGNYDMPLQMLISTIDYNDYVGRIGIGKIHQGIIDINQDVILCNMDGKKQIASITNLYEFDGLNRKSVDRAQAGDIVAISGVDGISIGDTVCHRDNPNPLPFVNITEPTVSVVFMVNDSPFAGLEGEYVASRNLGDRLFKELKTDVSLRVERTDSPDKFKVSGRGELHISILIERMRREGFEFQISKPTAIYREIEGKLYEPMELVLIDVPERYSGVVIEKLSKRRGELLNMQPDSGDNVRMEFSIPSRGLFGYQSDFLTDTKGEGILNTLFDSYMPYKGDIPSRKQGALVAFEDGEAVTYGLHNAQERGTLLIGPGTRVYRGMIVGISSRQEDIDVNVCRKKHVTNIRAAGSDDALRLIAPKKLSLEEALELIDKDELVEVTPKSIRLRKAILDPTKRRRASGDRSDK